MSARDVLVLTCFRCPFGVVEKASARGTIFDCAASKAVDRRPLTVVVREYTEPPPPQCPLRHDDGITLRVKA